jgi:hypothetical protein
MAKKKRTTKSNAPRLKSGRLSPKGLPCLCGCGEETATEGAKFKTGHDARLKGILTRIFEDRRNKGDSIPAVARVFLKEEGLVGFKAIVRGKAVTLQQI